MGAILAKFRRDKTTYQVLENLEDKIKDIEEYTVSTQERQKRIVGNFLIISIGFYVVSFIIFYFLCFPPTWRERILYSLPLVIFPFIILFLKRLVAWYFQTKLNRNSAKLSNLKAEKKKVIEKVMDKETYKVALEIINRFADKPKPQPQGALTPKTPMSPYQSIKYQSKSQQLALTPAQSGRAQSKQGQFLSPLPLQHSQQQQHQMSLTPNNNNNLSRSFNSPIHQQQYQLQHYQPRTPFPIVNQSQKGVFEKMVDFLTGDGPSSHYGMICKQCFGHNGMTSQEEFEYSAFRCAFCKAMNPAKKLRPIAPALDVHPLQSSEAERNSSTSPSEKDSGSDSDQVSVAGSEKETAKKDDKDTTAIKPEEHSVNNELPCQNQEDKDVEEKSAQDKKED